ncbi:MAG: thioredoxin domain-containing protein [Isosphaeraceae bacterium]|nr:thioredoxin domain-containing protein [Isosphaeraceae bacterium]
MTRAARLAALALLVCAFGGIGCEPAPTDKPATDSAPIPPAITPSITAPPDTKKEPAETAPKDSPPAGAKSDAGAASDGAVTLQKLTYADFLAKVAKNPGAKYTIVDAWASWCGPCKENFPHLVAMNQKYAGKGLAVASLSLDDPKKPKDVAAAEKFLREKKATFTNVLLDEDADAGVGFEKLNVNSIPAVFVFDPSGKEVKRFTGDDPNNQFTYDEVEKYVVALLEGKTPPGSGTEKKKGD